MHTARASFLASSTALITLGYANVARAGNDEGILVGGYAALTGGAVTATVGDGSASWYNPAGLARSTRQTLDLNASAYGISLYAADNLFRLPDGTEAGASVVDWQLIPSALSYTRQLSPRVVGSFSIVSPTTTDADLATSVVDASGTRWQFDLDTLRYEYDYLLSVGVRVTERLRVGVTLNGVYISTESMTQVGVGTPGSPGSPFVAGSDHHTTGDYGLRLGAGLQWSITPSVDVGIAVQTPTLTGFRRVVSSTVNANLPNDPADAEYVGSSENSLRGVWELSTPVIVRAGLALSFGRAQVMLDGSLYSAIDTGEDSLDRRWMGNGRVGTLVTLSEALSFGLGAFTDLNGLRSPAPNFVGVAGGARITKNYHVVEGARDLSFFTTLAGRYAYGFGHVEGVDFSAISVTSGLGSTRASIRCHELAFNLGGGVSF